MNLSTLLILIGALLLVAVCLVVILRRSRSSGQAPVPSAAMLDAQAMGEGNRGVDRQGRA